MIIKNKDNFNKVMNGFDLFIEEKEKCSELTKEQVQEIKQTILESAFVDNSYYENEKIKLFFTDEELEIYNFVNDYICGKLPDLDKKDYYEEQHKKYLEFLEWKEKEKNKESQ